MALYPFPSIDKCSPGLDNGPFVMGGQVILPWKMLHDKYQVEWCCLQGGMQNPSAGHDSMSNFIEAKKWVDLVGGYYWISPGDAPSAAADWIVSCIAKEQPRFVWLDVEEHASGGINYDDARITKVVTTVYQRVVAAYPKLRVTLYTRPDFILTYSSSLRPLLASLDHIAWAAWPDYGLDRYYLPLESIYAGNMLECLDINAPKPKPSKPINIFDGAHGPDMALTPKAQVVFWQHSSRIIPADEGIVGVPLYDHGYDFDRANRTHAQLVNWADFVPDTPPPQEVTLASLQAELDDVKTRLSSLEDWRKTLFKTYAPLVTK